jgi:hypothetical protein
VWRSLPTVRRPIEPSISEDGLASEQVYVLAPWAARLNHNLAVDVAKLRAYWFRKQGLDGSLAGQESQTVLSRSGWARSVGGSNPYLTLYGRAGISRKRAEADAQAMRICELPSARGCTYVLPQEDFALGLSVGQGFTGATELATARRLGVSDAEVEALCQRITALLSHGALDPRAIKDRLGDAVRNLGEEGKKRGLQTTLPLALGVLQRDGRIVRAPVDGRLDSQRYAYRAWSPSPGESFALSQEEAFTELARRYWRWIGPATAANFQGFAALGAGAARKAVEPLALVPIEEGSELLILPEELDAFHSFQAPREPRYALVASIDSLVLLRRDLAALVDARDQAREVFVDKGMRQVGHLMDLPDHGIFDRGRLVGLWEYDPFETEIVWQPWIEPDDELTSAVARTESFVRDELGDARSFSLDSPESRRPVIEALRGAAAAAV